MPNYKHIIFIYFSLSLSAAGGAENSTAISFNFSNASCLDAVSYGMLNNKLSADEILKSVETNIPNICSKYVANVKNKEFVKLCLKADSQTLNNLGRYSFKKQMGEVAVQSDIDSYNTVLAACNSELTADVIFKNSPKSYLAKSYSNALLRELEQKKSDEIALSNKRDAEQKLESTIDLAKQNDHNFDLKGLILSLSKQKLQSLTNSKFWEYKNNLDGDTSIEIYNLELARLKCIQRHVMMKQECSYAKIFDETQLSVEGRKITTLGGQLVLNLTFKFFEGKPYEYTISLGNSGTEIESGLVEKFGKPTLAYTNKDMWISKEETLEYFPNEAKIHVFNTAKLNLAEKHHSDFIAAKESTAKNEAKRKEKAVSEGKKKDF